MKKYIGHEPSGGAFNQIVLDNDDKPHNPIVNSGAIMSAALLLHSVNPDLSLSEKFEFVRKFFIQMAGDMMFASRLPHFSLSVTQQIETSLWHSL